MTTHFTIDLIHPGRMQRSGWKWFLGPEGPRHLAIVAAVGLAFVGLVALGGISPRYLRHATEVQSIAKLRREVTAADNDLATLRTNLGSLGTEARRQVRWSEMLPALSRWLPGTLRIDRVSLGKPGRPGQAQSPQAAAQSSDVTFQIEVSTTVVPGSSRLVEIANFMAALAQDPAVAPRFQLKTWEVRPSRDQNAEQLNISIALVEKRP